MNNKQLTIFLAVCQCKSFNRAAKSMYLSTTAVIKEINSLEYELGGVKLFHRSYQGVELTRAGQAFLPDAEAIMRAMERAKQHVRGYQDKHIIIVANYPEIPSTTFNRLWAYLAHQFANYEFHYKEQNNNVQEAYYQLGHSTDLLIGPPVSEHRFKMTPITTSPFELLMTATNPLSQKTSVDISDLKRQNQTIYMNSITPTKSLKRIMTKLKKARVPIKAAGTYYQTKTFYRIDGNNECLLSVKAFESLRPELVAVPFEVQESMPICIIANRQASPAVIQIFNEIRQLARQKPELF